MSAARPVALLAGGRGEIRHGAGAVWKKSLAGVDKPLPTLAYVGAAAGDSAPFRLFIGRLLKGAGAGKVLPVKLCGRRPDLAAARAVLDGADAVFVSGGDVEAGMKVLEDRDMTGYLRALAAQGKPFIGLSAGSLMLARGWVRWRDADDEGSAEAFPCLGIADLYCDAHDEESGWSELKALLEILPAKSEGWGIPAGGLLVAHPDGSVTWEGTAPSRFRKDQKGIAVVMSSNAIK